MSTPLDFTVGIPIFVSTPTLTMSQMVRLKIDLNEGMLLFTELPCRTTIVVRRIPSHMGGSVLSVMEHDPARLSDFLWRHCVVWPSNQLVKDRLAQEYVLLPTQLVSEIMKASGMFGLPGTLNMRMVD